MLKRLIPVFIFISFAVALIAQRPSFVPVDMSIIPDASRAACDNKAGTSTQTLVSTSQSNDKTYLCYKDKLTVKHNKDQVLTSDPILGTPAGVGYLYLTCNPTTSGPTIQDVAADPCVLKTPSGGVPPLGFYVETGGNVKGDNEFNNDGYWQTAYGSGKPFKLVFAPITFDRLNGVNPVYEGTPSGQCVHVNTAASFEVIYLNEIKANVILQTNQAGSFKVLGGLPEYDGNTTSYTVDIALKSNPAIKGAITSGAAKHNGIVDFTTPQNGLYTITVEDGKSCGAIFDMVISSAVDVLVQNDTICAGSKGKLTIVPSGGTAPYTYTYQQVSPGAGLLNGPFPLPTIGSTINDLDPGTYNVIVQDNTGAVSAPKSGLVFVSTQTFSVNISVNNPTCPERFDGNATANVVGGFGPFYYEWSNGEKGSNKPNITGIGIANGSPKYSVTVTDRFGCTTDASANLTVNGMVITNVNSNNATCFGAKDGQISFSVTGGTPIGGNYDFRWQLNNSPKDTLRDVAGAALFDNRNPGKYSVTITDLNGCRLIDTTLEIKANRTIVLTKTPSNAKCFNDASGAVSLLVTQNGLNANHPGPVNFTWNPQPSSTAPISTPFTTAYVDVKAGKYKVTVTDAFSCIITDSVTIQQPTAALDVTLASKTDPTCSGNSTDGKIFTTASGGTPPYAYKWDKGIISILPNISNLVANTYTITVTDANSCSKTLSVTLTPPPGPQIDSIKTQNVNCFTDNNGSIKVFATKANAADVLSYKWSNNATTPEISNLSPGKYTVTVTDQKGCAIIADTAVLSPKPLVLVGQPAVTKPSCPNSTDGSIEIEVEGGTADYTYQWASQTTNGTATDKPKVFKITQLPVGVYNVSVTDKNNCPSLIINLINVSVPPIITVSKVASKAISCANSGSCDGEATYTVTDGNSSTGFYFFTWAGQPNGISAKLNEPLVVTGLCRGWNKITISDGSNCTQTDSVLIDAPVPVAFDSTTLQINPVRCFGGSDGSVVINAKGGQSPYTYTWSHGPLTNTLTDMTAGDYILTIKDSKNCEFRSTVTVPEPPQLVAAVDPTQTDSVSCARYTDGKIGLTVSGGNPGGSPQYAFVWSPNVSSSAVAKNLPAGSYSVIVSDSKGCTVAVPPYVIGEPDSITFMLDTIVAPICNGYLTEVKVKSVSGGNGSMIGNYRYSIDDETIVSVKDAVLSTGAGEHIVKVYDQNGCFSSIKVSITEPPSIRVYLGQDIEIELGDSREINAVIEPVGIPIVKYNWSWSTNATPLSFPDSCKNACAQIIKPFADGSYILQVESAEGCLGSDTINLTIDRNRNVFIPNIFSPNVDGTNDFLEVFADPQGVEQINFLKVYDRWGTLIFESPSFIPSASRLNGNRWNGYYKDGEANIGVYVYVCEVKFVDGVVITFRGDVMLAR